MNDETVLPVKNIKDRLSEAIKERKTWLIEVFNRRMLQYYVNEESLLCILYSMFNF